jgi:aerobic carbon-monoxide dehydrogenase medium subunit
MVVELRYPQQPVGTGTAFVEFARRLGDFAIASAAAALTMRNGACERARLTISGMGEGPFRVRAAEEMLTGQSLVQNEAGEAFAEAAAMVVAAVDPADDVHASPSYRRHLAGVMAEQALQAALRRAGEPTLG